MRNHFFKILREKREAQGLTQFEMSKKLGFKNPHSGVQIVARIERGEQKIPKKRVLKFAKVYGVEFEFLARKIADDVYAEIIKANQSY